MLALPALWNGKHAELAVTLLNGVAARGPLSPEGLRRLGLFEEMRGRLPEARAALEQASAVNASAGLLLEAARIAHKQGDREGAFAHLTRARELEPRNAAVQFFYGMVAVDLDRVIDAEKALALAVELEPANASYNYALGAALEERKPEEAIEYFRRYCRLKGGDPRGRLVLANAYFDTKDFDASRSEAQPLTSYPATAAGAHFLLGRLAIRAQELPEAQAHLLASAQGDPKNAAAYAELGFVYLEREDFAAARKALDHALVLDPDNRSANLHLLRLYQRTGDARTEAQARRFEEAGQKRNGNTRALLRSVEVRPYE
jgi:tetratricopeptide (TPR) repeat protein